MDKEKVMQLISQAIDNGAYISVHEVQINKNWSRVTREEAEKKAVEASVALDSTIEHSESEHANSFDVSKNKIRFAFSYNPYMEEDVNLDGGSEEHATA